MTRLGHCQNEQAAMLGIAKHNCRSCWIFVHDGIRSNVPAARAPQGDDFRG
jgi:hypothetical protein